MITLRRMIYTLLMIAAAPTAPYAIVSDQAAGQIVKGIIDEDYDIVIVERISVGEAIRRGEGDSHLSKLRPNWIGGGEGFFFYSPVDAIKMEHSKVFVHAIRIVRDGRRPNRHTGTLDFLPEVGSSWLLVIHRGMDIDGLITEINLDSLDDSIIPYKDETVDAVDRLFHDLRIIYANLDELGSFDVKQFRFEGSYKILEGILAVQASK